MTYNSILKELITYKVVHLHNRILMQFKKKKRTKKFFTYLCKKVSEVYWYVKNAMCRIVYVVLFMSKQERKRVPVQT